MIKITKDEMKYLVKNGIPFGEGGISHTWTHHHHYYLCEVARNINMLKKYRDSVTC